MSLLNNLFTPQLDNLQQSLSLTTRRQSLLTNNLANVNVPGYKRKDIDFNITLQDAMNPTSGPSVSRVKDLQEAQAQDLSDQTSLRQDGNNVDMEKEVMSISETQMRYQALTQMTSNYFMDLKSAIKEGR